MFYGTLDKNMRDPNPDSYRNGVLLFHFLPPHDKVSQLFNAVFFHCFSFVKPEIAMYLYLKNAPGTFNVFEIRDKISQNPAKLEVRLISLHTIGRRYKSTSLNIQHDLVLTAKYCKIEMDYWRSELSNRLFEDTKMLG